MGADRLYLDYVGKPHHTFYGLLARCDCGASWAMFSDDDFAEIYCPDNGRDSVPPSRLRRFRTTNPPFQGAPRHPKLRRHCCIAMDPPLGCY